MKRRSGGCSCLGGSRSGSDEERREEEAYWSLTQDVYPADVGKRDIIAQCKIFGCSEERLADAIAYWAKHHRRASGRRPRRRG